MKRNELLPSEKEHLLKQLQMRFEKHPARHPNSTWDSIQEKIVNNPALLRTLNEMELSGGEPDVVDFGNDTTELYFVDCAAESPKERRSLCYDREALDKRKEHKPANDALTLAQEIGIELLTEEQYQQLQMVGDFDLKTSSWLKTPDTVRKLGGAIFGDKRYGRTFIYHNGAESYYAARGFRGCIRLD